MPARGDHILHQAVDNGGKSGTYNNTHCHIHHIPPGDKLPEFPPMGSYASLSNLSKVVLILDMLLGRLEIFPMLMLLAPSVWVGKRRKL